LRIAKEPNASVDEMNSVTQAMAASERAAHLAAYRTNFDDKFRQIRTKRHLANDRMLVTFIKQIYLMFLAGAPPNPSFHYVPVSDDEVRK
jgi:hypothetical protein